MARFAWKVTRGHRDRVLVLKTPSHGAHLGELRAVFGDRLRVVHVTREPGRVVESNMRMHHALRRHALGDPIGADALRARIVDEYVAIERATRGGRAALEIPSATLAHERVASDPVGALGGALDAIGAPMTAAHAAAVRRYLASLGAHEPDQDGRAPLGTPGEAEADALGEIRAIHRGLDTGGRVAAPGAVPGPAPARARVGRGVLARSGRRWRARLGGSRSCGCFGRRCPTGVRGSISSCGSWARSSGLARRGARGSGRARWGWCRRR